MRRNAVLEAELAAMLDGIEEVPKLYSVFNGEATLDEYLTRRTKGWLTNAAYRCCGCEHVFEHGETVNLKRYYKPVFLGGGWTLESFCDECYQTKLHSSWWTHRKKPISCEGGCGVLVSSSYRDTVRGHNEPGGWVDEYLPFARYCSRRCTEIAARERRRVPEVERDCENCGDTFSPMRTDGRYCSNACRQRAYRRRKVFTEQAPA